MNILLPIMVLNSLRAKQSCWGASSNMAEKWEWLPSPTEANCWVGKACEGKTLVAGDIGRDLHTLTKSQFSWSRRQQFWPILVPANSRIDLQRGYHQSWHRSLGTVEVIAELQVSNNRKREAIIKTELRMNPDNTSLENPPKKLEENLAIWNFWVSPWAF